jgi:arginase
LDEDNIESKINMLDQETVNYWYQLKNVANIAPKIKYSDLVYIAMRDSELPEQYLLKKHKVKNFAPAEVRKRGVERVALDTLKYLQNCDLIYVSFDVDALDSSISKGTGTPVPNGITEREAGNLLARLMCSEKVCGFEMVEVNPTLDRENLMAEHAFEILVRATNALIND